MTLTLFLENTLDGPISATGEVSIPEAMYPGGPIQIDCASRHLSERWYRQFPIRIPDDRGKVYVIDSTTTFQTESSCWRSTSRLKVYPRSSEEIAESIRLARIDMPTDQTGRIDRRYRRDTLVLDKPIWNLVRRLLGSPVKRISLLEPFSYQAVVVKNRGPGTVTLLVSSRVVDARSGETVAALAAPDLVSGGTGKALSFAAVPAAGEQRVVLPIFLDWRKAAAGTYQRVISLQVWGTDQAFYETKAPLELIEPSRVSGAVVFLAVLAGLGLLVSLLVWWKRFFARFQARDLVFAALFATTIFSIVTVPTTLFSGLLGAFFGPLSVLITGLANEVVYYALLVPFLVLVPKPGSVALLIGVRFLLNGLVLGQLSLPGYLYSGMNVIVLESACFLARFTTNRSVLISLAEREGSGLWASAAIVGAADALMTWLEFLLTMQLYRLFYASWYIALTVSVNGFLYTLVGVHLGARLGRHLGRIAP